MNTNQDTEAIDEIREEYDFANMKDGVRGKYSEAFGKTKVAVLLECNPSYKYSKYSKYRTPI